MTKRIVTTGLLLALGSLTGCPEYPEPPPPVRPDGGTVWPDGGVIVPPIPPNPAFPGSIEAGDSGLGVLFLFRIDRGTANLGFSYTRLVDGTIEALSKAHFSVRAVAAGSLYEPRLFWSNVGPFAALSQVLQVEASKAEGVVPVSCTSAALAELGAVLSTAEVKVPPEASTSTSTDPVRPFAEPLTDLLVVLVDHADRPLTPYADACRESGVVSYDHFNTETSASWAAIPPIPRIQTRFLFLHTAEGIPYEQYQAQCQAFADLPRAALDAVEPSEVAFFGPFLEGINAPQATLARSIDLCDAIAGDIPPRLAPFASDWARELAATLTPKADSTEALSRGARDTR